MDKDTKKCVIFASNKDTAMLENFRRIVRNRLRVMFHHGARTKMAAEYRAIRGREADFENPRDFSEWVMSGIVHRRFDRFAHLADKLAVRDYVRSKGLGELLPEVYGVWRRPRQIDYTGLPERFVLKTNHGCGWNIVCRDRSTFDRADAARKLNLWRRLKYNPTETHYSLIKPRIYAEQFIDDGTGELPVDYKFMCFRGEPLGALVCKDRDLATGALKLYFFDDEWRHVPEYMTEPHDDAAKIARPRNFEAMKEYARVLSAGFDFVRVDFYDTGAKVWFGEMTFTPAAGRLAYFTDEALREMFAKLNGCSRG